MAGLFGGSALGDSLGQVLISVGLDTKPLEAGLAKVKAETTATGQAASSGFSKLTNTLAVAIPVAAGAAAAALVKFSVDAIGAAVQAADQQSKLANAIENSASVTKASIPAFQEQASAIRDLTGVDDDAINAMQGFLIQMGLTATQVTLLTPLVVDLSQKMGVSLDAAAKAVGKSVNGTITGLSRMGVVVDKAAAAADPFAATLDALGAAAGFAAEKARAQPWIVLSAQFDQLKEEVGQQLLPALQELIPKFTDLLTTITPGVVNAFSELADISTRVTDIMGHLVDLLPDVGDGSGKASFGVTVLGKALEQMPFYEQTKNLADFVDKLDQLTHPTVDAVAATHQMTDAEKELASGTQEVGDSFNGARDAFIHASAAAVTFAHKTGKALEQWRADAVSAFDDVVYDLSNLKSNIGVTAREFLKASKAMQDRAKQFASAMKQLASKRESWVPEDYVAFLQTQGPEWLIGFTRLTEQQQHKAVAAWRGTNEEAKGYKGSVDKLSGAIRNVPEIKNIKVNVDYYYNNYDPTKPIPGTP